MVARIRRHWRLSVGLCCLSLALLLVLGAYKAFGQIPPVTQTAGPTVGFSESSYTVGQGQTVEIAVVLDTPASQDVTINYAASDGQTSGTLTIPAGALSGKLTVPTKVHRNGSSLHTMNISLSSPANATLGSSTVKVFVPDSTDAQGCQPTPPPP